MDAPTLEIEHPKSCSSWFASDPTTGERICDCGIAEESNSSGLMQHDLAVLMRLLGIGDYARPHSPHVVFHDEILPAVRRLKGLCRCGQPEGHS